MTGRLYQKKVKLDGAYIALHGDDEGHSETEAPTEHGPVTSVPVLKARVDQQQEGHAGGEELWQAGEAAHLDPADQAWGCPPGGHGTVTVRQITVTAIALATENSPKKDPAVEGE